MTFGLQQILLWLAVSWDSLVPYAGLQAAAEGKFYNTNLNGTTNPSATSCLILYTFPWNTLYWWRNSFHAVLELHLDESGWTMLDVGGRNQDWLPAQGIYLEITTVSILRMWLFSAEVQVFTVIVHSTSNSQMTPHALLTYIYQLKAQLFYHLSHKWQ